MLAWLAFVGGCGHPNGEAEIPRGEWTGSGAFVYETWPTEGADEPPVSLHNCYPTHLSIRDAVLGGERVVEIEIRSERGRIDKDLGELTHIIAALRREKTLSDSAVTYRLVHWLFNPKEGEQLNPDAASPPASATCMAIDGDVVLQIHYSDEFSDTFRFRRRKVYKSGSYVKLEEGLIHWAEILKRD